MRGGALFTEFSADFKKGAFTATGVIVVLLLIGLIMGKR